MRNPERVRELEAVYAQLDQDGQSELARRVRQVAEDLRQEDQPDTHELITTGEAAEILGVRSINTVKRWVREGALEGFRRGSRILVSRASVQRMVDAPAVAAQHAREREMDALLETFEPSGAKQIEVPPSAAGWVGHKPWETADTAAQP
jgi:excisionase family DNA binding protein